MCSRGIVCSLCQNACFVVVGVCESKTPEHSLEERAGFAAAQMMRVLNQRLKDVCQSNVLRRLGGINQASVADSIL